jgi:RNA polymerase sigma factor (sigma-70 family)
VLTAIYREHSARAYRFAYHLTRSPEDADDLVQAAFLGLHRALVRGDAIVSPGAWLSTTIKRSAINLARKGRERPSSEDVDRAVGHGEPGDGAGEAAADLARIQLLLHTLPEAQHHAFVLRHWSGLSNRDIAEVLATTESAVESLLVRARAAVLAAGSTDQACAEVCSRLSADRPLTPRHVAHLSSCRGCRTAQQRLAKAAGIAAIAALVPNIHVAHALAATVPGFNAGLAAGGGGGLAAAVGTKVGAAGALTKTGVLVVALTATAAIGVHAHLIPLHQAHAAPTPRPHGRRVEVSRAPATRPAGPSTPTSTAATPVTAPTGRHAGERKRQSADGTRDSGKARSDGSGDGSPGASGDGSPGASGDGGGSTSAQDGGAAQDGTPGGSSDGSSGSGGGGDGGGSGGSGGSGRGTGSSD